MSRLMVVEDEPSLRLVLSEVLEEEGFGVLTAPDGMAALAILRERPAVDLFLIDLFMPRMSGRELIVALRREPGYGATPVILVTGAVYQVEDYPPAGSYSAVLQKPFALDDVVTAVRRSLASQP